MNSHLLRARSEYVIPAEAGIQNRRAQSRRVRSWIPAFAGMTCATLMLVPTKSAAQTNPYSAALARQQIRAVSPPTPAKDFALQTLAGKKRALSDSQGHWVLLTFFATWCGPCKTELPTIQRLFEAEQGRAPKDRVHILGVAIEPDPAPVRPFAERLGVTFPVLVDTTSSVASTYRAQSIPVSYLISPDGRLVGVSRGARDWSQATSLFNELTESVVDAPTVGGGYQASTGNDPVQLPRNLTPPTASATLAGDVPQAAKPFTLRVEVHWAGNLREYILRPPEVSLPEGVTTLGTSAHTSSREGRAMVTYDIALQATQPGSYVLNPVEIRYTPLAESEVLSARIEGPTVVVETARFAGLTVMGWVMGMAGLMLLLGVGAVGRWTLRRKDTPDAPADPLLKWQELLEDARAKRIRGDYVGCLEALAELEGGLGPALQESGDAGDTAYAPSEDLGELLEAARYGGQAPPKDVLDRLQRRVERALSHLSGPEK